MGITRKIIKERNFLLTIIRDGADDESLSEDIREAQKEIKDIHPLVELADCSEITDLSGFTEKGVTMAATQEHDRKPYKQDRLAILVSTDEVYAMASKYKAISIYYLADVQIFRDFHAAVAWLGLADIEKEIDQLRRGEE